MEESKDLIIETPNEVSWRMDDITEYVDGFSQNRFRYLFSLGLASKKTFDAIRILLNLDDIIKCCDYI